jgi:hypothetical protein
MYFVIDTEKTVKWKQNSSHIHASDKYVPREYFGLTSISLVTNKRTEENNITFITQVEYTAYLTSREELTMLRAI